ncbi:acyl-coenzyme A thioesterase 13-like [Fagus crenata]
MAKGRATPSLPDAESTSSSSVIETKGLSAKHVSMVTNFLRSVGVGVSDSIPDNCNTKEFYSDIIRDTIKPDLLLRGRVTCLLTVKPTVANFYGSLHGGAVAAVAEMVSIACVRTVVAEDKEIFLGDLSISYLSAAPMNAEVIVDGSVLKSGRNLTVVGMEFKLKKTGQLAYTARAVFYNMPIAKL